MTHFERMNDRLAVACRCSAVDIGAYGEAVSKSFSSAADAFAHYQASGRNASPELFPFIDPDYYASQLDQPIPEEVTPFEHYVIYGAKRNLSPISLFDLEYIHSQSDDLQFDDIFDFLSDPDCPSIDPHPLFSKRYYLSSNPDVSAAGADPFHHFVRFGWRERRAIHPFFRMQEYLRFEFPHDCSRLEFNKCLASAFENSALALMQPLFDVAHYLRSLGSSDEVANPLQHFLTTAWRQGVSAFPLFNQAFFLSQTPPIRSSLNPYIEYLSDFSHAYAPNEFFDPAFYLRSAPGASTFKGSLLEHFVRSGAANGGCPHRMVTVSNSHPSRYSGFRAITSFIDASGRLFWLRTPDDHAGLAACINETREIEPELPHDFLDVCSLHPYCGPLNRHERMLTRNVAKCARCNCLVISQSSLGHVVVSRLLSLQACLVSNARPWLTLISCSAPLIRYWHVFHGCTDTTEFFLPGDRHDEVLFMAAVIVASIPNKLVVRMDALGVALLRRFGPQILATVPEVSLLLEGSGLDSADEQWLFEYVATKYPELGSLIYETGRSVHLTKGLALDSVKNAPRMLFFS